MKVSINIVTYNGIKYIDDCLKSIFGQTFGDFEILIVDNASEDGTVEYIRKNYPDVTVLQNFKNLGFAKAHNQAIKFWPSEYVLITNQDVVLKQDYLEKIMAAADKHPECASFGGKTLKLNFNEDKRPELNSTVIDSAGIIVAKTRRFYERGAGEEDGGQYNDEQELFGISGNLVLYRREALEKTKINSAKGRESYKFTTDYNFYEYFDENFFIYKEDVDLAWRLQWAGWSALYVPTAVSFHYRSAFGRAKLSDWATLKNRRSKSKYINQLSYRNHLLMLAKNEPWANLFLHLPWILFYELKKFCYVLVLETTTLKYLGQFFQLLPNTWQKRRQVRKMRKVSVKEMRRWFR